jgi:TPR repeat protein
MSEENMNDKPISKPKAKAKAIHKKAYDLHTNHVVLDNQHSKAREMYYDNWKNNGYAKSYINWAVLVQNGIGGPKNETVAREAFKDCYNKTKHPKALYNYASMMFYGIGGVLDQDKALLLMNYIVDKYKHDKHFGLVAYKARTFYEHYENHKNHDECKVNQKIHTHLDRGDFICRFCNVGIDFQKYRNSVAPNEMYV